MSYFLSPVLNEQQCNANGVPLSGGKIYTYLAGTSTPAATYTDSTSGTQQANPIILNSLGLTASPVWLQGGIAVKFVIKDSADVPIRTVDNVAGINDISTSAAEWNESGLMPTYISGTQFSVPGDQTGTLQVNRRVRTKNSAGYVYGRITASVYTTITTVTVINDSGALDSGLTFIAYGFLSFSPSSIPYALYAGGGANGDITSLTALTSISGQNNALLINTATTSKPSVRQTVLSGAVDSNGLPSFGGSTGSTTVTFTSTLIATAANGYTLGGGVDYTGSIANPSWTGLSTNGTMYLYVDIAANGTCTAGSTTLAPVYQWGGTYSTTSNQFTFNIQEMIGKVGNGTTAAQTYRVFVGEVTVAAGVVSAITWYALQGRYQAAWTATLPGATTAVSQNHNIGVADLLGKLEIQNTTTNLGYAVGDIVTDINGNTGGFPAPISIVRTYKTIGFTVTDTAGLLAINKTTGANTTLTVGSWKYRLVAQRTW